MRNYGELPDILSPDEVKAYFQEALQVSSTENASPADTAEAIFELARRQWHTYEPAPTEVKAPVEAWIKSNWNPQGEETWLNHVLSAIVTLQLDGAVQLVKQASQDASLPESTRKRFDDALLEFTEVVETTP